MGRTRQPKILLAGKHELACTIYDELTAHADIDLIVALARREDCKSRRSLSQCVRSANRPVKIIEPHGWQAAIEAAAPDLLISAGFDRILPATLLAKLPRSVNIHFGMLPKYRGNWSIPWAILNNEGIIGVTLHDIAPSIDDGAIIRQTSVSDTGELSCGELYARAIDAGVALARDFLYGFLSGAPQPGTAQDERQASYYPPEYPHEFRLPWKQVVSYVARYIRAAHFPPYRGAFSEIDGSEISFEWPVGVLYQEPGVPPGSVVESREGVLVATLNGFIKPESVWFDGTRYAFRDLVTGLRLAGRRFNL
jgi:methionyl-tRNA formyltransferase